MRRTIRAQRRKSGEQMQTQRHTQARIASALVLSVLLSACTASNGGSGSSPTSTTSTSTVVRSSGVASTTPPTTAVPTTTSTVQASTTVARTTTTTTLPDGPTPTAPADRDAAVQSELDNLALRYPSVGALSVRTFEPFLPLICDELNTDFGDKARATASIQGLTGVMAYDGTPHSDDYRLNVAMSVAASAIYTTCPEHAKWFLGGTPFYR